VNDNEARTRAQYDWLRTHYPDLFEGAVQVGHIPATYVHRTTEGPVFLPMEQAAGIGARVEASVVGLLCRALGMPR